MDVSSATLGSVVAGLHRRISWRLAQMTASFGVMPGQFPVLSQLKYGGPCSQQALAASVGIEQSSMTATLSRMEKAGLIVRRSDGQDGRRKLVSLTAKGEEAYAVVKQCAEQLYQEICADISEEEITTFLRVGQQLRGKLE